MLELESYKERLEYLRLLDNNVHSPRHMSQSFYKSHAWRTVRDIVIQRDLGFDLGIFGLYIEGPRYVHHIDPIVEEDIVYNSKKLLDPENLITASANTHNTIHYNQDEKETEWVERTPGDTKLW